MATELPSPLYSGFFPQMVLTVEELMHYRRFGKERVAQLVRIIDDADCVYRWTDMKARNGRPVQKAQFLDIQPSTKQPASQQPSTILKSSVHIVDVQPEEILQAIAKVKTKDARRAMSYLHGEELMDTQTLLTFPTSSELKKPSYSYRAVKWCLLKAKRREGQKSLDFCYLEYAGKRKAHAGASSVVGFCVQESIARDREVPTLERYDILRGQFMRTGIVITKTHQSNILKITSIAQIDGAMVPAAVRMTMEEIMVDYVAAVHRVKGLLERQRMGRLQYLDEWEWVSTKERKACAVCLRNFYFHRKHHCATCGEVVCSNCAPLRELEEPLDEHTHAMRVCSLCMAQAGSHRDSSMSGVTESEDGMLETTTSTTNVGTETYVGGLRYPKHRGLRRGGIEGSLRGSSSQATPIRSPLPPFRQRHHPLSSRSSAQGNGYEYESDGSEQYQAVRRERRSSVLRHSTLSSSTMSAQAKKEALDKLVEHVRQIRDTISVAISEAEEEEERHSMMLESGRGDPDAGAERFDEIYDRIMKIRETLDVSSLDFDAVLESIGHNDVRPSDTVSDRLDSDLAFSLSEGADSEHPSESVEFLSSRSSLLSASVQSLDHQDAGEPLPTPTSELQAEEEARALEEAMQWVRQSEPTANLHSTRAASAVGSPKATQQIEPAPPVVSVSKNRGIERLSQKIGRLQQRLEASQRESEASSSGPVSVTVAPVTPTPLGVPPVVDEQDEQSEDEPEPEKRPTLHRRQSSEPIPVLKQPQGPGRQNSKEKHVAIAPDAAPSSPSPSTSASRLSEPARAPPDLVASLRGVMNSSELTHAPPRRRSGASSAAPSLSPPETPSSTPAMPFPTRNSYSGSSRRAPPPPPPAAPPALPPFSSARPTAAGATPVQGTTIYVFDPEDRFQRVQRRSLDRRPPDATEAVEIGPDEVPGGNDGGEEVNPRNAYLSSSDEEREQARGAATRPPVAGRVTRSRDESGELRELMESLAKAPLRSRCSSGQSTGAPPTEKFDF
ncbi:1-phosphatidylinositol 3-phosphate 5-kinase FAB1 [Phytophthora citrophthora]|uniref:1-phosphatidylinositol 3-phosphate 5-kinase FAB1 n=1 Tax=Phytophthora citrophthora TaxID=4793 RepID=A0AAD9LNC0_9STRA|nr:1-phosphatidylinositol 3-phosphate 5-kinase FAB1 [Phytophthora citrophthora]